MIRHLKLFLIFALCAATALTSCNKKDDLSSKYAVKIESDIKGIDKLLLTGYLENGSTYTIGTGGPSEDGYTIYIDNPLPSIFLYNIKGVPDYAEHFQFSNPNVMCYNAVHSFNAFRNNQHVGRFSLFGVVEYGEDEELEKEAYSVSYIYVTDDVSITGTHTVEGKPYHTYDLHLKKGWNRYATIEYFPRNGTSHVKRLYTSDIPAGVEWILSF